MQPYLTEVYGNPSSVHASGRRARHAVEESRDRVAAVLKVDPSEIVFTSGGTESDNAALFSTLEPTAHPRLVTGAVEHEAVLSAAAHLKRAGVSVTVLPPDEAGSARLDLLEGALKEGPALVSLMHVNNETGALNPVAEISMIVHEAGGLVHSDAVQSSVCYALSEIVAAVDLLSLSAHKIGGPKGAGLLFARAGAPVGRVLHGGSQERKRRAGTENVAAIVGFASALEWVQAEPAETAGSIREKRDRLVAGLRGRLGEGVRVTTPDDPDRSAPHIVHAVFPDGRGGGLDGEMLILGLDLEGVQVSSGAACSSGAMEPSHVVEALGIEPALGRSAIRFSLGSNTTFEDIAYTLDCVEKVVARTFRHR